MQCVCRIYVSIFSEICTHLATKRDRIIIVNGLLLFINGECVNVSPIVPQKSQDQFVTTQIFHLASREADKVVWVALIMRCL